jgi:transcriptional regulator of nitric oxide reductase
MSDSMRALLRIFRRRVSVNMSSARALDPVLVFTFAIILTASPGLTAQTPSVDALSRVAPQAESFSPKQGLPPVYTAFGAKPDAQSDAPIVGYVFETRDFEPQEVGL